MMACKMLPRIEGFGLCEPEERGVNGVKVIFNPYAKPIFVSL